MNHLLDLLAEAHNSRLLECVVLFLIPFLHEDVAIFTGVMLVVEYAMPTWLAVGAIFTGMIASDFALFGVGALAGRSAAIRRLAGGRRVERLGRWIEAHSALLMVLARFLPGLMFPVYVACGFARIPVLRFAAITTLTALVYFPIVFGLVLTFGVTVLSNLGLWSWGAALILYLLIFAVWGRSRAWDRVMRAAGAGAGALVAAAPKPASFAGTHRGMPSIEKLRSTVSFAERIPPVLFYIPLGLQWAWLGLRHGSQSLPTIANPMIEVGGLWGESKSSYLDMVAPSARRWLTDYATLTRQPDAASELARAEKAMTDAGLSYPVVVKPDIGWRGFGVRLCADQEALSDYLGAFPEGRRYMLQRLLPQDGEAGVLYARLPGEEQGRILTLTFRYFPHVVGDGASTLRDLILGSERTGWKAGVHLGLEAMHEGADRAALARTPAQGEIVRLSFIGSNRVGGLYRDAGRHITPALERRVDEISKAIPEFYYGRYDIRFGSVEGLRAGEDFGIIEINGAGGESINVWDPEMPLRKVYAELFAQQSLLFEIGARNRARGFRPVGLGKMLLSAWRQHQLILSYPPSS